ncbi:undecaprenyldiphospho-muramoylpentapeptide beta-N-acetylglucosaminyltransferase [Crenobacter sp. SG2303]|uniref:UDP-N-acetylglucosamine--N-acetylmuramyl-(pentapeptide) pyrophosphoryl-undecaprenol N-acetylglucosamine transferase n=1 Tax=Crenobacter oryzisoli TaxID=3056844 RepID=A0ABT7XMK6_9NEIS|nr:MULTISPECIES: undecaprenyldiphospho-muramoylpentapeptide beta-N-acetylglucosaminyltransferase [unclassified Crenobacter]MDN0075034.1 undecaprenyldiphospho-muramoylpentapeptide beta-N-acetylglucosaminyltransferase [Crenobacter sp. SG2303]MDN0081181.1 undecaprenyldiphospho-muramoylpentapeptide beta-N-acetylglucosaminyltransferase [Crenobacter sp. SG2305]
MAKRTIMVMAGGTGGHIFPGLAVAKELAARGWAVIWLGADGGMETRLVPEHGIEIETLKIRGVRGNGLLRKLTLPFVMVRALLKSAVVIFNHRPDIAIGFGGYPAFPGGLMSRLLWKPLVVHEQNSVAGLTNRVLSKIASRTLFAFPGAFPGAQGLVGNPVRADIAALPTPAERFAGRSGPLRVLVVGGSLGAKVFNDTVPQALAMLAESERPLVVHQAGAKQIEALQANYRQAGVAADCRAFIADMAAEYAAADVVLCRAGALTVAELAAAGVGSLLVPFPHAVDDHQTGNAKFLADAGAARLVQQKDFDAASLAGWLRGLNRAECLRMAEAARAKALTDAAARVADVCEQLTQE